MEILKAATEWAKDEVISAKFFIFFGIMFLTSTIIFWQLGKTEVAKAFIFPMLIAGTILLAAGIGFLISNNSRLVNFENEYKTDPAGFVKSEIARVEKTMGEYENVALKIFPIIVAIAAILVVFIDKPIWRAIFITIIAFMLILIILDSNANSRLRTYHKALKVE